MGKRCVAAGCSSTHLDGQHLYGFPKNPELRKKWADQVKRTRDKWEPTAYSYLCSKHFEDNSLGVGKVRALLKPGAIPTLFEKPPANSKRKISPSTEPTVKRRIAVEKRERFRVMNTHTSLFDP